MAKKLLRVMLLTTLVGYFLMVGVFAVGTDNVTINTNYSTAPYVYNYTGGVQQFNVPNGINFVKVRLWGSQGGDPPSGSATPGKGGYVESIVDVRNIPKLYVYVGSKNTLFNGAGAAGSGGSQGGGATDIRTVGGAWDDESSLSSRISVAGGGAGLSVTNDYKYGASYRSPNARVSLEDMSINSTSSSTGITGFIYYSAPMVAFATGGGGGGYYGGSYVNNFNGTVSGLSFEGASFANNLCNNVVMVNSVALGNGRVEITPLVGDSSSLLADNVTVDLAGTVDTDLKFIFQKGNLTFKNLSTAGKNIHIQAPNSDVTIADNPAYFSCRIFCNNLHVSNSSIILSRFSSVTGTSHFEASNIDGDSTGSIQGNTVQIASCKFVAGKVWQMNTTGDITVSGTSLVSGVLNGLNASNISIGVSQSDYGLNSISLAGFYTWFMQDVSTPKNGGTLPMEFVLERKVSGSTTWDRQDKQIINLTGNSSLRDLYTIPKKDIAYRVGFKRSDQTGYIVVQDNTFVGNSPGSYSLDEMPPVISLFSLEKGASSVGNSFAEVAISATDNKTTTDKLEMQLQVNNHYFKWNNTMKRYDECTSTEFGPYTGATNGLPIEEGVNTVSLRIKDLTGNTGVSVKEVIYVKPTGSAVAPNLGTDYVLPKIVLATDSDTLDLANFNRGKAYISNSPFIFINFKASELPADIVSVKYAISGDSYSKSMPLSKTLKLQFPPVCGAYTVKLIFTNKSGIESTDPTEIPIVFDNIPPNVTIQPLGGRTVTKTSIVPVTASVSDNTSLEVQWSMDKTTWTTIKDGDTFNIPVPVGIVQTTVYFRDQAENISSARLKICRVN